MLAQQRPPAYADFMQWQQQQQVRLAVLLPAISNAGQQCRCPVWPLTAGLTLDNHPVMVSDGRALCAGRCRDSRISTAAAD